MIERRFIGPDTRIWSMNKTLIAITLAALVSGCSSMQHVSTMTPGEQHLAAKTKYYEELNQRQYRDDIHAISEIDTKLELASAQTVKRIGQ
jgi:uncharacterized protein YceK